MFKNLCNPALIAALLVAGAAQTAFAQAAIGTRAQGMAGAFVGVADDATAVYWNPAGIATGAFVSAVIDFGKEQPGAASGQIISNQQNSSGIIAVSATAFGLAYYRTQYYGTGSEKTAVSGVQGREEVGRSVQAITASVAGVSLLQSLSEHLVIGVTPKWMRGVRDDSSPKVVDVDAGAMYYANHVRLGLVARNLTTPAFKAADGSAIELDREMRAGAAWGSGWTGISRVIVSADADLMTRVTPSGDRRDLAGGVETWWLGQRLGLRGGLRRSTIGDARAAFAAGISAGLTQGTLLEAHVVRGQRDERSWSVGARMTF
jgi:hypothetical protein